MKNSYNEWLGEGEVQSAWSNDQFFIRYNSKVRECIDSIYCVKTCIVNDDLGMAAASWLDMERDDRILLISLAPTKGGIFTTEEREIIKTNNKFASEAP